MLRTKCLQTAGNPLTMDIPIFLGIRSFLLRRGMGLTSDITCLRADEGFIFRGDKISRYASKAMKKELIHWTHDFTKEAM
jgi:hypothetical protein